MNAPHYAFYVLAEQQSADNVRETLLELGLEGAWTRIVPASSRFREEALLQVEITDLEAGLPIFAEELGPELSKDDKVALVVGADGEEVAFSLFVDGEVALMWGGAPEDFEAEDEEGAVFRGKDGFFELFQHLTGEPWEAFFKDGALAPETRDQADDNVTVNLRGRVVEVPTGMTRRPALFHFHDDDALLEASGALAPRDDRVALVLLHPPLLTAMWEQLPAAGVLAFLDAVASERQKVLGPLAHSFDHATSTIAELPSDDPIAASGNLDLLTFEVLALATALGYGPAASVEQLDQRFLPLYALGKQPPELQPAAIADQLDDINGLGSLSAMTEALPYRVPEGQLLECIDDEHIAPLAPWAQQEDGSYAGSVFLVRPAGLKQFVEGFSREALVALEERFLAAWHKLNQPNISFETWRAQRRHDIFEWQRFEARHQELVDLISLGAENGLAPALVFYGD